MKTVDGAGAKLGVIALLSTIVLFSVLTHASLKGEEDLFAEAVGPRYIYFDDYCDVLKFYVDSDGSIYGEHDGCEEGYAGPAAGARRKGGISYGWENSYGPFLVKLEVRGRTWELYENHMDYVTLANWGTWTPGPPPTAERDLPSILAEIRDEVLDE